MKKNLAEEFMKLDRDIRSGSLCLFGCWFGRPMDNIHISIGAKHEGNKLILLFDEGITIQLHNPTEMFSKGNALIIADAESVKFTKELKNDSRKPLFAEYIRNNGSLECFTNIESMENPNNKMPSLKIC